jgi:hypothetical protein
MTCHAETERPARPKPVYLRDLPEYSELPANTPKPVLACFACGAEYSADRGDYFWKEPSQSFRCNCKGRPLLRLVTRASSWRPWRKR